LVVRRGIEIRLQRGGLARVPEPDDGSGLPLGKIAQAGLAYRAAGIGLALLELYGATGRVDFLEAGRGAFDHEDTLFDADQSNWADGRLASGSLIYERTWCHGAPGIALSRLRSAALDPEYAERHQHMSRISVSTTLDAIEKDLVHPRYDASVSLGLAGLGEVVLIAGQMLDDQTYHERAPELGRAMIERHSASADWPSGVTSGCPNPSFMLGLAGIGHWFLRLHDPRRVRPLLLLIPERIQLDLDGGHATW
jgi:lantibiotic biosynthesis protein